jgi:hypothetical protein
MDRLVANSADAYLTPWKVVNCLKAEFAYVEVDGEEGHRHVLETIGRIQAAKSRRYTGHQVVEHLARVKSRALFVCFGDDAGHDLTALDTYVIPGMPLTFEYASATHKVAAQPLLIRCTAALGYNMREDRRIYNQPGHGGLERRCFRIERRRFVERRNGEGRRKYITP